MTWLMWTWRGESFVTLNTLVNDVENGTRHVPYKFIFSLMFMFIFVCAVAGAFWMCKHNITYILRISRARILALKQAFPSRIVCNYSTGVNLGPRRVHRLYVNCIWNVSGRNRNNMVSKPSIQNRRPLSDLTLKWFEACINNHNHFEVFSYCFVRQICGLSINSSTNTTNTSIEVVIFTNNHWHV